MPVTAGPSVRGGLAVPGLLEQLADQLAQPALGRFLLEAPAPVQRHVEAVIGQVGIAHRIAAALDAMHGQQVAGFPLAFKPQSAKPRFVELSMLTGDGKVRV